MKAALATLLLLLATIVGATAFVVITNEQDESKAATDPTEMILDQVSDIQAPEVQESEEQEQQEKEAQANEPDEIIDAEQLVVEEPRPASGLTKQSGVNWYNGRKETWYSSRVLRHYMIDQWEAGEDGVYRDANGYVVVACSDIPYGTIIDTSFGAAKVYDCGCDDGITDIYVNW